MEDVNTSSVGLLFDVVLVQSGLLYMPMHMRVSRRGSAIIMEGRLLVNKVRVQSGLYHIPMPMESPRRTSAIVMEFRRRTHLK